MARSVSPIPLDHDIPPPPPRPRSGAPRQSYRLRDMRVGDSFKLPLVDAGRLRSAAYSYQRRHPGVFFETDTTEWTITIWRVA